MTRTALALTSAIGVSAVAQPATTELTPRDLRAPAVATQLVRSPFWMLGTSAELTRVDAGIADLNALSVSLRQVETGLGPPRGFEDVYQVPGREDMLMRASGALFAVFPYSVYTPHRGKQVPVIPASTVFHIGEISRPAPGPVTKPSEASGAGSQWTPIHSGSRVLPIDERRLADLQDAMQAQAEPSVPTILNSPEYRQTRLSELIRQAANAERYNQAQGDPD